MLLKAGSLSGAGHFFRCLKLTSYLAPKIQFEIGILKEPGAECFQHLIPKEVGFREISELSADFFDTLSNSYAFIITDLLSNEWMKDMVRGTSELNHLYRSPFFQNKGLLHILDVRQPSLFKGINLICNDYRTNFIRTERMDAVLYTGSFMSVFSKEMQDERLKKKNISAKPKSVAVVFGSALETEQIKKSLQALDQINLEKIHVVNGNALCLKSDFSSKFFWYDRLPQHEVVNLMKNSDVVLTNEGQTKSESAAMGIPTIVLPFFEENSLPLTSFYTMQCCLRMDLVGGLTSEEIKKEISCYLRNQELRRKHSENGLKKLSDIGVYKAIQELQENELAKAR